VIDADGGSTPATSVARRRRQPHDRPAAQGDVHPRWIQRVPAEVEARSPDTRGSRAPPSSAFPIPCSARSASRTWCSTPDAAVDADDLDAILADCALVPARIADYKAPDRVVVVDELPLTAWASSTSRRSRARGSDNTENAASGGQMRTGGMKELIYHRQLLPAVERAPDKVTILDGEYRSTQQEHFDRTCRIAHALATSSGSRATTASRSWR
jgi:hypothetical protein